VRQQQRRTDQANDSRSTASTRRYRFGIDDKIADFVDLENVSADYF
jgi:hypothetical protein